MKADKIDGKYLTEIVKNIKHENLLMGMGDKHLIIEPQGEPEGCKTVYVVALLEQDWGSEPQED